MRRRLLNKNKSLLPETQAVINRAVLEGFTLPNDTTLKELDNFIRFCISEGIFGVLDYLRNSAYNDLNCEDFSRINIANPSGDLITYSINGTSSISYTLDGIKLNSTQANYAWLVTPIVIEYPITTNNYKRDNASKGTVLYEATSGVFTNIICGVDGNTAESMRNDDSAGQRIIQSTNNLPSTLDLSGTGLKAMTRLVNDVKGFNKYVVSSYVRNYDTGTRNYGFYLEGFSNNVGSNMGTSMGFLGGYLTDTQVLNFRTAYNNYLTNIGLSPVA